MSSRISPLIVTALFLIVSCIGLQSTNDIVTNTIQPGHSLNTSETIVSANGNFELGFFSPGNSTKYYMGIRYSMKVSEQNVVWVANREYGFIDSSAALTLNSDGNLVISDGRMTYMVANTSAGNRTYAMLLDTGNLIITNRVMQVFWQSFDNATDTLLPGMTLGVGGDFVAASWKSTEDPAPGLFSLQLGSSDQLTLMQGSKVYWTSSIYTFGVLASSNSLNGTIISWPINYTSDEISRMVLDVSGQLKLQSWSEDDQRWNSLQSSRCGDYALCGAFSICNETAEVPCGCLTGFRPVSADAWSKGNSSSGCVRETDLQCTKNNDVQNDGFLHMSKVDWPDNPWHLDFGSDIECQSACLNNCSCIAYTYYYKLRGLKPPCLVWDGSLLNLKQLSADYIYGIDFNLKLATSDLVKQDTNSRNQTATAAVNNNSISGTNKKLGALQIFVLTMSTPLVMLTLGFMFYYVRRKLRKKGEDLLQLDLGMTQTTENSEHSEVNKRGDGKKFKMPLFSLKSVSAATDNFSDANKLGEGGFGPVYKGILLKGDEVAVKRLSRRSGQGWEELKNEAMLIAKLQHKNLVRLLGCCIEQDEKILVYEYMSNKSLDFFLFDPEKRKNFRWGTRLQVIEGVAQELLYLHQYSRFRIIHRDLKASNILLDSDMNPKISDFGMARIFGGKESQANTNRIVGTYFGVLLLEITSGQKSTSFYLTDSRHLLGYAWELWTSERGSDLVDPLLDDVSSMHVALRYINIALLCVQESAADRPTMSEVVAMLSNESAALPYPKEPAFLNVRTVVRENPINSITEICSVNDASVSNVQGR
uniref:Receptor-like serine/threonine-protein kinase n=1 Tax=Quercus lobata TaxID=97700 RepID=A0A7N2MB12_QUELO